MERSWVTKEKTLPININKTLGNEYQIIIDKEGCATYAYSYTPVYNNLTGMLIRHEEVYTICKNLSIRDSRGTIVYKPSCYYVYRPCDSSVASLLEVKDNFGSYHDLDECRLMTSDIIEGRDEVGCTLFFSNGDIYWIGSLLDIKEARLLYDNEYNHIVNPTIVQVVAGYIGGLFYLIDSIEMQNYKGFLTTDDLPVDDFIKTTQPLLGPFGLLKVKDWELPINPNNLWQFEDFLVKNKPV
jgi:homospermidine synthase